MKYTIDCCELVSANDMFLYSSMNDTLDDILTKNRTVQIIYINNIMGFGIESRSESSHMPVRFKLRSKQFDEPVINDNQTVREKYVFDEPGTRTYRENLERNLNDLYTVDV